MNEQHITLKYVHVDSKHRHPSDSRTRFNVQIPHGFNHVSKVCIKDFSIPNTFGNTKNIDIQWVEYKNVGTLANPLWHSAIFQAVIPDDEKKPYMNNNEIQLMLQNVFTNASGQQIKTLRKYNPNGDEVSVTDQYSHKVVTSGQTNPLGVVLQYDSDYYKFRITPEDQSSTQGHIFMIYRDADRLKETSIWEHLGFPKDSIPDFKGYRKVLSELIDRKYHPGGGSFDGLVFNNNNLIAKTINRGNKVIRSVSVPTNENHVKYVHVASDVLGKDGFTMKNGSAIKTNILESVPNTSQKFSYLHHTNEQLGFHDLRGATLSHFDIILLDENFNEFDQDSIDDFKCTVVFQEVQEVIKTQEEIRRYNDISYRMGHPTN
jgi:hypothetical protein